jgi:hypothetical protein
MHMLLECLPSASPNIHFSITLPSQGISRNISAVTRCPPLTHSIIPSSLPGPPSGREGIDEKAAGIVHKLLLKGKKLRQVSKNHKIAHINLTDKHIHDYIHYSTVFSLQHFGSKPRWALRYAQDELAPGHEPTSSASNSDRAIQQLVPSKAVEAQALGHATLSGAVEPLVELQSPDHRQREAEHDVSSPVAFLPGAEDSLSPVLIT